MKGEQIMVEIAAERTRQQKAEGWTPEHDDGHTDGVLARVAAFYALATTEGGVGWKIWPKHWEPRWYKPTTKRRDLIKAAALIVAEIERLDRAEGGTK
ncbi:hypothetical protein [Deinococcus arenicola]|uniref:Uncharacterized protein n=1 Tax=Deinococcus arenicola TaxID=2994950 RepID=A0ABU4DXP7_9DEIO|nr:hypothetical protein [Deinococcus sp. ZS9-10]MDV6376459.1 hypothetical protein [Deinococcus sp. ZS9-10]